MELLYIISISLMLLATIVMIGRLYEHLELKENRELLILVFGLCIDFAGSIAMVQASEVAEIVLGYRVQLIGRAVFGFGFILYYGRSFRARMTNAVLSIWSFVQFICIIESFRFRGENFFLSDIVINKYYGMSILVGDKHVFYYLHVAVVSFAGAWGMYLVIREYFKVKAQKDKGQSIMLMYFALGVLIQGLSLAFYEIAGDRYPDFSSLLRGIMALIYSAMAAKYHFVSYESLARDTLLNDIGAGFIVLTTSYRIIYFNEIATEAFPDLANLAGMSPYSEKVKEAIDMRETEIQRMGNTYRISADRIYNRRRLVGYSVLITNVTDYILLEKQASVSRDAKEKLLTNMAHELRTPINAISGEAEMMLGCSEPEKLQEYAKNIQSSVDRLTDSFNYLLEAFNEETQVLAPTDNPYNMCVLLDTVITNCAKRAAKKHISFSAKIDPLLYTDAVGDDSSVYKLLMNIISSAIRYTESGGVDLSVSSRINEKGECEYEFIISDTGEHAEQFTPIVGVSATGDSMVYAENAHNTGISFLLAKRLLESLKGQLIVGLRSNTMNEMIVTVPQKVSSQNTIKTLNMKGKMQVLLLGNNKEYWDELALVMDSLDIDYGYLSYNAHPSFETDNRISVVITERPKDIFRPKYNPEYFKESFMVYADEAIVAGEQKNDSLIITKPFSTLTLRRIFSAMGMMQGIIDENYSTDFIAPSIKALVVDDEYLNRRVATQILENFKIKVESVASGYECIDLLRSGKKFDIIFMDYMMEGMNGIDTTKQIRALNREVKDACIVAFTANDAPGAKEKYFAAGMNAVLFKPAGKEDFAKIIREFIPADAILEKIYTDKDRDNVIDFEIPGVDPEIGLKYVSGSVDTYKSILVEFGKEIYSKSAKISQFYALNDWYDFTVYVHGVKSSSRMLGLEQLGEMMAGLEIAGKNEDREYIDANLTKTLDLYESFVSPILALDESEEDTKEHSSLYKLISEIKSAVEDFELEDVENLVGELESGNYGSVDKEDLDKINESIKAADYYELLDCVVGLLDKVASQEEEQI
ncbi:MAG: response regulator [Lachnospiraceae bacterium]|nr:response regulator [Lachnospiraceae bacterium]